jgi:hypothetical protein
LAFRIELEIDARNQSAKVLSEVEQGVRRIGTAQTEVGATGGVWRDIKADLLSYAAALVTARSAMEAIQKASELSQLRNSLAAITGSVKEATVSMQFFHAAQRETQATALEMATFFRDALPQAIAKGFDPAQFRQFTVELSNFARAVGRPFDELQYAWRQLIAGRVTGTNSILEALGISRQDLASGAVYLDDIVKKMQAITDRSQSMNFSLATSFSKIKSEIIGAFVGGFDQASASGKKFYDAMTDPKIIAAVHELGRAFADILPPILKVVEEVTHLAAFVVKMIADAADAANRFIYRPNPQTQPGLFNQWVNQGFAQFPTIPGWGTSQYGGPQPAATAPHAKVGLGARAPDFIEQVKASIAALQGLSEAAKVQETAVNSLFGILVLRFGDERKAIEALRPQLTALAEAHLRLGQAMTAPEASAFIRTFLDAHQTLAAVSEDLNPFLAGIMKMVPEISVLSIDFGRLTSEIERFGIGIKRSFGEAGVALPAGLSTALTSLQGFASQTIAEIGQPGGPATLEAARELIRIHEDAVRAYAQSMLQFLVQYSDRLRQATVAGFQGLFDSLSQGGNWSDALNKVFRQTAANFGDDLWTALFGKQVTNAKGETTTVGLPGTKGPIFSTQAGAYAGGALQLAGMIANLQAPGMTVGMGALTGGLVGLGVTTSLTAAGALGGALAGSIVPIVGTIIGAVVGALSTAFAPSVGSTYEFGIPYVSAGGKASIVNAQNLPLPKMVEIIAAIQNTFDQVHNAFVTTLEKFGPNLLPKMTQIMDQFQGAASAHWAEHMQQWIDGTLPKLIADQFYEPLLKAFESYGVTADRFKQIYNQLEAANPKQAAAKIGELADAVISMWKSIQGLMQTTLPVTPAGEFAAGPSMLAGVNWQQNAGVLYQLSQLDEQIFQVAASLNELIGPDQIDAAKQLADLVAQRYQAELQWVAQVKSATEQVTKSFQQAMDQYALAGMVTSSGQPDFQSQIDYMVKRLADTLSSVGSIGTPQGLQDWFGNVQSLIGTIYNIGIQSGGDPKAWAKWAADMMTQAYDAFNQRMRALGAEVDQMNQEFLDQLTPIWDTFISVVQDNTDATTTMTNNANDAADSLDHVRDRADAAAEAFDAFAERLSKWQPGTSTGQGTQSIDVNISVADPGSYVRAVSARRSARA